MKCVRHQFLKKLSIILTILISVDLVYAGYVPSTIKEDNTAPLDDEEFFTTDSIAFTQELKVSLGELYEVNFDKYISDEYIEEKAKLASMSIAEYKSSLKPGVMNFADAVEIVGNWYAKNVKTYGGNSTRKFYSCDIFCNKTKNGEPAKVGDDCTSFAYTVIALCADKAFFLSNSSELLAGTASGNTFDDKQHKLVYASAGFETLDANKYKPGDNEIWVLDGTQFSKASHVECILDYKLNDRSKSFGWGSVKDSFKDIYWLIHKSDNTVDAKMKKSDEPRPYYKLRTIIRQVKKEK